MAEANAVVQIFGDVELERMSAAESDREVVSSSAGIIVERIQSGDVQWSRYDEVF